MRENEICLPDREYLIGYRWERINMDVRCIVHMHIAAELKPTGFLFLLSSVMAELITILQCVCVCVC